MIKYNFNRKFCLVYGRIFYNLFRRDKGVSSAGIRYFKEIFRDGDVSLQKVQKAFCVEIYNILEVIGLKVICL